MLSFATESPKNMLPPIIISPLRVVFLAVISPLKLRFDAVTSPSTQKSPVFTFPYEPELNLANVIYSLLPVPINKVPFVVSKKGSEICGEENDVPLLNFSIAAI